MADADLFGRERGREARKSSWVLEAVRADHASRPCSAARYPPSLSLSLCPALERNAASEARLTAANKSPASTSPHGSGGASKSDR